MAYQLRQIPNAKVRLLRIDEVAMHLAILGIVVVTVLVSTVV